VVGGACARSRKGESEDEGERKRERAGASERRQESAHGIADSSRVGRPRSAQPRTVQPFARSSGRSRPAWSPRVSTAPAPPVPPVPQARFSSAASAARNASFLGSSATTVTLLPPRPFFSSRSTQRGFSGTVSSAAFEQWQSSIGQPHFGQR